MNKLLKKMIDLYSKGQFDKAAYDTLDDEEKKELAKAIDGEKNYASIMAFLKDADEEKDGEENDGEGEKDGETEEKEEEKDTETEEKPNETELKKDTEEKEDEKAMNIKAMAEAKAYQKALSDRMKNVNFGDPVDMGTKEGADEDTANTNLRKAFLSGQLSAETGGVNVLEKAVNSTPFLSVDVAEKIFGQNEIPQRLIDLFYTKRISGGDTARFVEVGKPTAAVVAKGAEIAFTDDATVTGDTAQLEKVVSAFRIAREDVVDPNTNLQELFGQKASEAVRETVETRAVASIVASIQSTNKIKIAADKESGAANNVEKISYTDVISLGANIAGASLTNPSLAMHPSMLQFILGRTGTTGHKIFDGSFASNVAAANIDGIQAVPTAGLDNYTTLKASTTDNTAVLLLSDWANTCGVAYDSEELIVMSTYNQSRDSYDVSVMARAKAVPVVLNDIVALTIDTA